MKESYRIWRHIRRTGVWDARVYKTHPNFSRVNQEKNPKQSTNIERDEIDMMNIINDNVFNLYNRL